jgi:cation diffusion facilitator family transporter
MLLGKWVAYWLTGSHAILSDALESVVHIVATGFALFSLIVAARPPDTVYPYGYGKIGFFSAGFEGGLIALAGLAIVYESIQGMLTREPLQRLELGLLLITSASVINFGLGWALIKQGKATRSLILEADGRHVLTDSYTSFAVVAGIALVWLTKAWWLDPLIAIVVGLNILRTAFTLSRTAYSGLMGRADTELLEKVVAALQQGRKPGWLDLHHLRAWQSGDRTFVDFHLVVPPDWTVLMIHDTHVEARKLISDALEGPIESIVHFDPDRLDRPVDPLLPWTMKSATRPFQDLATRDLSYPQRHKDIKSGHP